MKKEQYFLEWTYRIKGISGPKFEIILAEILIKYNGFQG